MSLLLKAALAANLPPPKPEDFTGYQVTGIIIGILVIVIVIVIGIHVTIIVMGILVIVIVDQIVFLIDCQSKGVLIDPTLSQPSRLAS